LIPSVFLLLLGLLVGVVVVAVLEDKLEDVALDGREGDRGLWGFNLQRRAESQRRASWPSVQTRAGRRRGRGSMSPVR